MTVPVSGVKPFKVFTRVGVGNPVPHGGVVIEVHRVKESPKKRDQKG